MADGTDMKAQLARMEKRLDGMAQVVDVLTSDVAVLKTDVAVLKVDVSQLKNDMKVRFEHVDERFNVMTESIASFREQMNRRLDEAEAARKADRQMFYDILGNHERRIRGLEDASGRPA